MNPPQTPEIAMMETVDEDLADRRVSRSTLMEAGPSAARMTRSLSDGGHSEKPAASFLRPAQAQSSKDDSYVNDSLASRLAATVTCSPRASSSLLNSLPVTPSRLQQHSAASTKLHDRTPLQTLPSPAAYIRPPIPASPSLDHSIAYASPAHLLPRRSRGLDFSRAATSLHHSTLAESSPESSPMTGRRPRANAIEISDPRTGSLGRAEHSSTSLWSMMGNQQRANVASSVGSSAAAHMLSDVSSSSDDDDLMDEDMADDPYLTTPQMNKAGNPGTPYARNRAIVNGSPSVNNLASFQQRQRPRRQSHRRSRPPPPMLGFHPSTGSSHEGLGGYNKGFAAHSRRESISWAANQLQISGSESEDSPRPSIDVDEVLGPNADGQNRVVRRPVTRRSNMLPKTKTFARIRAALAEEGAPAETETMREAEVVRQVRESDADLQPIRTYAPLSGAASGPPSPAMSMQDVLDDMLTEDSSMAMLNPLGLSGSALRPHTHKNWKGKALWETFSEASSAGGQRITPPPPFLARASSCMSADEMSMDSPSTGTASMPFHSLACPPTATSSSGGDNTPLHDPNSISGRRTSSFSMSGGSGLPPSAAEITRRINNKRRRDDDLDPVSFKRRAVSPGMSVQGSPILQSPMQHATWGGSRPGSNSSERPNGEGMSVSEKRLSINGSMKGRVGFQGMVDTNDGITKLSID